MLMKYVYQIFEIFYIKTIVIIIAQNSLICETVSR